MFKKTMTFDNLEGEETTQTFYFNYKKTEVAELMEFGYVSQFRPDDISSRLPLEEQLKVLMTPTSESGLSEKENTQQAYDIFKSLILDAYGRKGDDNVTFYKDEELRNYFASHVAFDDLIWEMIGDTRLAASFIENCLPPKFREEAKRDLEARGGRKGATLAELVEEAEKRQQDPATRIEPGLDAALEAGVATPEMAEVARKVADTTPIEQYEPVKERRADELQAEDIEEMDDIAFQKLDVSKLNKSALMAAFKRKNQG